MEQFGSSRRKVLFYSVATMTTIAVGKITDPLQAEHIIRSGQADMVALARGMLYDPRWVWHAAEALRAKAAFPRFCFSARITPSRPWLSSG